MPSCRFETLAGWADTLVKPQSPAVLRPGPGYAADHTDKNRPSVDTYVAICRGVPVEPLTLKVTLSQPDDWVFHCRGKDKLDALCERERLTTGHTWKRKVEPTPSPTGDEYVFDVCLCYDNSRQYGVLRMDVKEDIPKTIFKIAQRENEKKPEPKVQVLEIILEGK